jgi:hypothetical protein
MKTNLKPYLSNEPDQVADTPVQNDLARRDGTIRGVILNAKTVNPDRVFGLTKPTKDFFF